MIKQLSPDIADETKPAFSANKQSYSIFPVREDTNRGLDYYFLEVLKRYKDWYL